MLALVVTALLTVWTGAVSITDQSAPDEQHARSAAAQPTPPDPDTVQPVTLAMIRAHVMEDYPQIWMDNCEAFNTWFNRADDFQLNTQQVLIFTDMLDNWITDAYEFDDYRLTPAARTWLVDKLHTECTSNATG